MFSDEAISVSDESQLARIPSDEEISEKYTRGDIRIVTEQSRFFLDQVPTMKDVKLDLGPEYQRRGRWNVQKKSRLIESFIMNIPVPPVFLYEYKLAHFEVMDGKQRLSTIKEFYGDEFKLEGLEYWPELEERKYSDLPETIKSSIDRRAISGIVLLYETGKSDEARNSELKQLIFERINSGGVSLSRQETRNALYDGPMNRLCIALSENEKFMQMWGVSAGDDDDVPSENYKDMTNVELVLRFFAMRQRERFSSLYKYLSDYLDFYLKKANIFPPPLLAQLEKNFIETIDVLYNLFGEKAFCAYRQKKDRTFSQINRPSYLIYEPLCYVFSKHNDKLASIYAAKNSVASVITQTIQSNSEKFKGRLSNPNYIFERIDIIEKALLSSI